MFTTALVATNIAYAADDTFSVVFPATSYFQSENPTLIAANGNYLIVYDLSASALFVRGNGLEGTYAYPLELQNVDMIAAVGKTAFIRADNECYTVDLSDTSATPVLRTLSSPQNANYFYSDGTYLYAKNGIGAVSVFDETLELAEFEIDEETQTIDSHIHEDSTHNPVFAGQQVLSGKDGNLYVFVKNFTFNEYIVYNPFTKEEVTRKRNAYNIQEAYVGDVIVAKLSPLGTVDGRACLMAIDKSTGAELFISDIAPDSVCAFDDKLFTVEGKEIITYTLKKDDIGNYIGFEKISTISMSGSDDAHLDAPCDTVKFANSLVVADSANKRLGYIDNTSKMKSVNLGIAPLRLAADSTGVYALLVDSRIVKVENGEITRTYSPTDSSATLDITYLDKLYLLKSDGLYTALGNNMYKLADITGGKRIACAKDGTNLYVLKDNCIEVYAPYGIKLCTLDVNATDAVDFAVDYAGQICILFKNKLQTYSNIFGALTLSSETELVSLTARATANSFCIDSLNAYFSADECLIGRVQVETVTKDTFVSTPYMASGNEAYYFAKLKEDTASYRIPSDGRMDGISQAPNDTLIVLDSVECVSGFKYAMLNASFFIIQENDFETVPTESLSGEYEIIRDTVLYALPNISAGKIEVEQGARVTLLSDCADYDNGRWWRVSYDDTVYFVNYEDCEEYIPVIPEEKKTYGKAKAKRVGGLVNVYSEPDAASSVLWEIVDGTQVEILDESDSFYTVKYNDTVGYMQKSEVKIGGLTTVQIITIAIAALVLIAGTCVFIAIERTRKKSDKVMADRQ